MTQSAAAEIDLSEYETGIMILVAIKLVSKVQREICVPSWLLSTTLIASHNLSLKGQEGENDGTSADGIHALRARILEVLRQEPYMGEKIPVR